MIPYSPIVLLLALAGAPAASQAPDSALVAAARARPDAIRDSLRLALAAAASDADPAPQLAAADRYAQSLAAAWNDSFPLRLVARFTAWSPGDRKIKAAADSLRRAGNDALGRDGFAAALRDWRESFRRCASLNDSAGMASSLGNIGAGFYQSNELDSAARYLTQSRTLAEGAGDWRTAGNAIGTLATIQADRGDFARAAELYARAANVRLRTGDSRGAAADRNNLGLVSEALGDLKRARRAFNEALASNRAAGRDEPAAANLINLGNLSSLEGDYPRAVARYREALALYRAHGNRVDAASVVRALGLLELQRGDYHKALDRFAEALAVFKETGPPADEIDVRRDIAATHAAMGNLQGALIQLGHAERLAARSDAGPRELALLALARADLAVEFNTFPEAERQYARAEKLFRDAGDAQGQAEAQSGLGLLLALRKDFPGALARVSLALRTQETLSDPRSIALTRILLGSIQSQMGDTAARACVALARRGRAP